MANLTNKTALVTRSFARHRQGDATLFTHRDGVEATWAIFSQLFEAWAKDRDTDFPNYAAGSWAPEAAVRLLQRDGRNWRKS